MRDASTGCSSQVEYCDNLIFRRRAALDNLGERLLDANRTIGQPDKITVIFGRKVTKHYRGKLQTEIEDMSLPNPVIRSHYGNGFIKQYVRDHLILRTEYAPLTAGLLIISPSNQTPGSTPGCRSGAPKSGACGRCRGIAATAAVAGRLSPCRFRGRAVMPRIIRGRGDSR
jgi:hypothetical protein